MYAVCVCADSTNANCAKTLKSMLLSWPICKLTPRNTDFSNLLAFEATRLAFKPQGNGNAEHFRAHVYYVAGHVFEDALRYTAPATIAPTNAQLRNAPLAPQAANASNAEPQEACSSTLKPPAGSKVRRPLSVNAPEFQARSAPKQSSNPWQGRSTQQQGSAPMLQGSISSSPLRAAAPPFTPHSALPPSNTCNSCRTQVRCTHVSLELLKALQNCGCYISGSRNVAQQ